MQHATTIMLSLDLLHVPSRVHLVRAAPLPDGVETLLRIAGGDDEIAGQASAAVAVPVQVIREAAGFFIEQAMLYPEADSYRVLGARQGATTAELRRNMALLLKWLHPDHGGHERSVFTHRVTRAWNDLKSEERRAAYHRLHQTRLAEKSLARKRRRSTPKTSVRPGHVRSTPTSTRLARRSPAAASPSSLFRRMLLLFLGRPVY